MLATCRIFFRINNVFFFVQNGIHLLSYEVAPGPIIIAFYCKKGKHRSVALAEILRWIMVEVTCSLALFLATLSPLDMTWYYFIEGTNNLKTFPDNPYPLN